MLSSVRHFLLAVCCLGSLPLLSQTPVLTDSNLLLLEDILSEYNDVEVRRNREVLSSGPMTWLELDYAGLPQTTINAFSTDGFVVLAGYFSQRVIQPRKFLRSDEAKEDGVWTFEEDKDGDLAYRAYVFGTDRESMETQVIASVVLLQILMEPHVAGAVPFDLDDSDAGTTEGVGYDVQACVDGVEGAIAGLPYEFRSEIDAQGYCECLQVQAERDPSVIGAMMNPFSPEGQEVISRCWDAYLPRWRELGITMEDMLGSVDIEAADEQVQKAFVRTCVEEAASLPEFRTMDLTYGQLESYCTCMLEEMRTREGLSFDDFNDLDGEVMVELLAACSSFLLEDDTPAGWNEGRRAMGCSGEQRVPLLWLGGGFKVKLGIGSTTKYILLDSGASEVVISRSWYNQLREAGDLASSAYEGSQPMTVADGRTVTLDRYRVSNVTLGDCTFSDFSVGVMDEPGMMMCGMGLLGLFDSWTIDVENRELILRN